MNISVTNNQGQLLVALEGRLDSVTSPELEQALSCIDADTKELILDFSKLEYLSSAGLRVLLSTQRKLKKQSAPMVIRHVCGSILEVFEITGFSDILTVQN